MREIDTGQLVACHFPLHGEVAPSPERPVRQPASEQPGSSLTQGGK